MKKLTDLCRSLRGRNRCSSAITLPIRLACHYNSHVAKNNRGSWFNESFRVARLDPQSGPTIQKQDIHIRQASRIDLVCRVD
jgi:hypothetical protein